MNENQYSDLPHRYYDMLALFGTVQVLSTYDQQVIALVRLLLLPVLIICSMPGSPLTVAEVKHLFNPAKGA